MSADPEERRRVERVLATARLFLGAAASIAIFVDTAHPRALVAVSNTLLAIYVVYSAILFVLLRTRWRPTTSLQVSIHAVDLIWASVITLVTEGPNSPFLLFFVFVLLGAAYRWEFWETLVTTAAAVVLVFLTANIAARGGPVLPGPIEVNRLIMQLTYLTIFGVLLGYLARTEKQLRAEVAAVASIMSRIQAERGLRAAMEVMANEILRACRATRTIFVAEDLNGPQVYLWEFQRGADGAIVSSRPTELTASEIETYLFEAPLFSWHARRVARPGSQTDVVTLDDQERRGRATVTLPPAFCKRHPFQTLECISARIGQEWHWRLYITDAALGTSVVSGLHFLQTLVRQAAPIIHGVYLFRRLRSRAGSIERARVARELHDGVIQSMIGIEMQLAVVQRRLSGDPGELTATLSHIQELVREEVMNLRELMQQMRPPDLSPNELLDFLADLVDRFQRETGIEARFVSELPEVTLPGRVCREVARIVQEALVNVRKHSGARHVVIRLSAETGLFKLVIDDDGQGFKFEGRFTQVELDARRKGPVVIKERVRTLGGNLAIESTPGQGARMEITLPRDFRG